MSLAKRACRGKAATSRRPAVQRFDVLTRESCPLFIYDPHNLFQLCVQRVMGSHAERVRQQRQGVVAMVAESMCTQELLVTGTYVAFCRLLGNLRPQNRAEQIGW